MEPVVHMDVQSAEADEMYLSDDHARQLAAKIRRAARRERKLADKRDR